MKEINFWWNIAKLLLLTPFLFFVCVLIAGNGWPIVMALALVGGWFWFKLEQGAKQRQVLAQQQVEVTRQALIAAQVEAEQARVRAEQAQIDADRDRQGQWMQGQWN